MTRPQRNPRVVYQALDIAGRTPVHDTDMERGLASAVLDFGARALDAVLAHAQPSDFYTPLVATILEAAIAVHAAGDPVDAATIGRHLAARERLQTVGGVAAINALVGCCPSVEHVEAYARHVADLAHQRRVTEAASQVHARGYVAGDTPAEFVEFAAATMAAACDRPHETVSEPIYDALRRVQAELADQWNGNRDPMGMRTGWERYDQITGGLKPGQLHTLAAYTGGGKSAFALQAAVAIAGAEYQGERVGVVYVSGEMSAEELSSRALCQVAGVSDEELQTAEWKRLGAHDDVDRAFHELAAKPLFFRSQAVAVHELPAMVRSVQRQCDRNRDPQRAPIRVRLVIIDYLQIMKLGAADRHDLAISAYTRTLKQFAMEQGVHVLLLSQFGRDAAKRGGRPTIFDLKESGSIENDSNLITLLHRPALSEEPESEVARLLDAHAEAIVAKSRGRAKGSHVLAFRGAHFRFDEPNGNDIEQWRRAREIASAAGRRRGQA